MPLELPSMNSQEQKQVLYHPPKRHNIGFQKIVTNSPCLLLLFGCGPCELKSDGGDDEDDDLSLVEMPNKKKKKMNGDHINGLNLSGEKDEKFTMQVGDQIQRFRLRKRAGRNKSKG
jgi:hypothetical protein